MSEKILKNFLKKDKPFLIPIVIGVKNKGGRKYDKGNQILHVLRTDHQRGLEVLPVVREEPELGCAKRAAGSGNKRGKARADRLDAKHAGKNEPTEETGTSV